VSVVQLDFYDREDLNGTPLLSIDDEDAFLEGFEMRVSLRDLGSGLITLSRQGVSADDNPSFLFDVARAESFVRVLVPAISSDYLFGFFLDNRKTQVLSTEESAGMNIIIGGSGPLYYLSRAILWNEKFSGTAATVDEETGLWTFPDNSNWNAGKVFETLLAEDSNNTLATFLPDLTLGFDETNDSDGNAWTDLFDGGLELEIGTHYLQALRIMQEQADDLDATMHLGAPGAPLMRLDMYNRLGRDLTGSTMGAGVVLFKAGINSDPLSGNILTGLEASGQSTLKPSHVLVRGADGVYSQVDRSLWSAGDFTKAVAVDYQETSGETSLFRYGRRIMADWDLREDAQQLEIHPGFDEANGLYMPGPDGSDGHFWIGDDITLKTGGEVVHSVLDYHYTTERVTGIRMVLDEAVDGSTDAKAALSWHIVPELNEVYGLPGGDLSRGVASRHGHPPNPQLCRPGVAGSTPALETAVAMHADNPGIPLEFQVDGTERYIVYFFGSTDDISPSSVLWYDTRGNPPPSGVDSSTEALGLLLSEHDSTDHDLEAYGLYDPDPSTFTNSAVITLSSDGRLAHAAAVYTGVDASSPVRDTASNVGTGTSASVTVPCQPGDRVVACLSFHGGANPTSYTASVASPFTEQDQDTGDLSAAHMAGIHIADATATGSSITADWTISGGSAGWTAIAVVLRGSGGTVNDGHPDLVGTATRAARCDHRHDVHRDSEPTVNDDWATAGYKLGTIWAQLDDLANPTEIVGTWMLVDISTGAAVWLPMSGAAATVDTTGDAPRSALFPSSTITSTKDSGNPTFNFEAIPENINKVGSTYYAVYQNGAGSQVNLATATDRDGPWTAYGSNPIFEFSDVSWAPGTANILYAPEIVEQGGTFYLFYSVCNATTGADGQIGVATATAITGPYTDHGSAILTEGAASTWDSLRVGEPSVIYHDGRWVMAYMGEDEDVTFGTSEKVGIATASSPTGTWTKVAGNPLIGFGTSGEWDDALVADPFIFFENGYYWIMYAGAGDSGPATSASQGLAYALDPTGTWTRHASNPILDPGASTAWDDVWAFRGCIWIEDGLLSGIYAGYPGGALTTTKGGNFRLTVTAPSSGASALDDLSDVTITSAAANDQLQYVGGTWVNNGRRWEPVVTDPGTGPELVFDGTGDIVMTFVEYS
jgi:hypothetical protein